MRLLWISSFARKDGSDYDPPIAGPGAVSGSLFQQSLISGFEELGIKVDMIIDYPYQNGRYHPKRKKDRENGTIDYIIPHFRIGLLSHIIKPMFIINAVSKLLKRNVYDGAIVYLIHSPYMKAMSYAKRKGGLKTILICPDLPDMMDLALNEKKAKAFLKALDYKTIFKLYNDVDGFVLFSQLMNERIPINGKKYMTLEGIASVEELDLTPTTKEKAIMYAGTLHKNIGIENIIKALEYLPHNIKLWFFGDGELKDYIIESSKNEPRIIYWGFVDRGSLFTYEKSASVIINARNPNDAYTRYSFPSKTFEYLYSGTPFLTTELSGIPREYNDYLYLIPDNNPETIAREVNRILSLDQNEIQHRANRARSFVITKTKQPQARKTAQFIDEVIHSYGD